MKLNKILLGATWALALLLGVSSCSEEWEPTGLPNNAQVYFSNENSNEFLLEENQSEVRVEISRLDTKGELSVGLIANDTTEAKLFTIPESVTFADGEGTATFPITFEFSDLVPDNGYALDINLASEFTEYADAGVKVVIKYAPWSDWAPYGWKYTKSATGESNYKTFKEWETDYAQWAAGGYADATLEEKLYAEEMPTYQYTQYMSGTYTQPVFYRESMLDNTSAQLCLYDWFYGVNFIIDWNKQTDEFVVQPQFTGYNHSTYGPVYAVESFLFFSDYYGKFPDDWDANKKSNWNEETGSLNLNLTYAVQLPENKWGYFAYGYETIQLPGYEQPDYSLTLVDEGTFKSSKDNLSQVINMTMGADVTSVKYAWFAGEMTDELVAEKANAIFDGSIESVLTKESGRKVLNVETEGDYYLVAVLYDADGARVATTSLAFKVEDANAKTWSAIYTGDWEYTVLFTNEDGSPYVDAGLTLFMCDQDATLYKIENWGYGVDFVFTMQEDGSVSVAEQSTGAKASATEEWMVCDYMTFTGQDKNGCYYEDGTFNFCLVYYVSRDKAYANWETFTLTGAAARTNSSMAMVEKNMKTFINAPFKSQSIKRAKKTNIMRKSEFAPLTNKTPIAL